jgi:hypothetical protein
VKTVIALPPHMWRCAPSAGQDEENGVVCVPTTSRAYAAQRVPGVQSKPGTWELADPGIQLPNLTTKPEITHPLTSVGSRKRKRGNAACLTNRLV